MLRGGLQILHRRKLGVVRVIQPRLAVFVPDGKHAAHGDVRLPFDQLVMALAEGQQAEQNRIDLNRFACRLEVHVVDADNALVGIAVVSVKHLVQMQIHRMRFIGARVKCLLIFRIADEGNHGVKRIHEYRAVFVHVGAARQGERGGKQHEQQDNGGFFHGKSYLQRSE